MARRTPHRRAATAMFRIAIAIAAFFIVSTGGSPSFARGVWVLKNVKVERSQHLNPGEHCWLHNDGEIREGAASYTSYQARCGSDAATQEKEAVTTKYTWSPLPKSAQADAEIPIHLSVSINNPKYTGVIAVEYTSPGAKAGDLFALHLLGTSITAGRNDPPNRRDPPEQTLKLVLPSRHLDSGKAVEAGAEVDVLVDCGGWFNNPGPGYALYTYAYEPGAASGNGNTIPWAVVGSGIAAVIAAASVIRSIRRRAKSNDAKSSDDKPDDDDLAGYVLQLDPDTLQLDEGAPQSLDIAVWKVDAKGGQSVAGDATIQIAAPAGAGISVTPLSGSGRLRATVALVGQPPTSDILLQVVASTAKGSKTGTVRITFGGEDMVVDIDGERDVIEVRQHTEYAAVVRYDEQSGRWRFGDLVVRFTRPGSDRPVRPGFTPVFEPPVAEPALSGLQFEGPTSDGMTWRWRVSLAPDAEIDEDWLVEDGALNVSVACRPEQARA